MPFPRAYTVANLALCMLLLGPACSTSSNSESDASQAMDGPAAAADTSQAMDRPTAAADTSQAMDGPTAAADTSQAVDGPTAAADTSQAMDGPAAGDTELADSGIACTGEYNACGCGCCSGKPAKTACYFPSRGETVTTAEAYDRAMSGSNCNTAGCSAGTRYVCCPALPAENTSAATYSVEWIPRGGGMMALQISKKGAECATILTFSPGENYTGIRNSELNWGLTVGDVGACGDAGAGQRGFNGLGAVTITGTATQCATQVSVHATVFGLTEDGSVHAVRMDADNLQVTPSALCP